MTTIMRPRFTIRDSFWLLLAVSLAIGWGITNQQLLQKDDEIEIYQLRERIMNMHVNSLENKLQQITAEKKE
jgi:hypothetical protein